MIYYLRYLFDNILSFIGHKNVQEGYGSEFGRIRNLLASWIRIRKSGSWIRGSGSEINIYGSATLVVLMIFFLIPLLIYRTWRIYRFIFERKSNFAIPER
jgi:hypothetical protein